MKYGCQIVKVSNPDIEHFKVDLIFDDGTVGSVSLRHIFGKPKHMSAEVLRGGMFERCFVESGALSWPNGFELCPDALYEWMKEQAKARKKRKVA